MNFISRVKSLDNKKDNDLKKDKDCFTSFNSENCITPKTKYIIIGTITPRKNIKYGYFYVGDKNLLYSILDAKFNSNLTDLKNKLRKAKSDKKGEIVEKIKEVLKKHKIAFLDTLKWAKPIPGKENSSSDDDLIEFDLDYKTFKENKKYLDNCTLIFTSRNAEFAFYKILSKNIGAKYCKLFRGANKKEWLKALK